jgi:hypothetical protein
MKRFFIIGNNYKGTLNALNGCENDCLYFEAEAKKSVNYSIERMTFASRQEVASKFKNYATVCKESDTFYFIFSGHGTQLNTGLEDDKKTESLVLLDKFGRFDFLRDMELNNFLSKIKCKKVIVLDCCFSGGMNKSFLAIFDNRIKRKFVNFADISGEVNQVTIKKPLVKTLTKTGNKDEVFLLACLENQFAIDLGDNGAFTRGIMQARAKGNRKIKSIFDIAKLECKMFQTPELKFSSKKFDIDLF